MSRQSLGQERPPSPNLQGFPSMPIYSRVTTDLKVLGRASRIFLLLLLLLLGCCFLRLLYRLAKLFHRGYTWRFQTILRNLLPNRSIIYRVRDASLKYHEGVILRSNFHSSMRPVVWSVLSAHPASIPLLRCARRTSLLGPNSNLVVGAFHCSGPRVRVHRPSINRWTRRLPGSLPHTNDKVRRVRIQRQQVPPPLHQCLFHILLCLAVRKWVIHRLA